MKVSIKPMGAVRMTQNDYWKPSARRYLQYKADIRDALPGFTLPARVYLAFYLEMPKSWSKKKKLELDGQPHQQRPDLDNLIKGVLDATASEDSHVSTIHADKYWATESYFEIVEL